MSRNAAVFERPESYDLTFGRLKPIDKARVSLSSVAQEGEFDSGSEDVFEHDEALNPELLPVFSLASKTATAVLLSHKYILGSLIRPIVKIHSNLSNTITPNKKDTERVRKLVQWGFSVKIMNGGPVSEDNYADDLRHMLPDGARTVRINPMVCRAISEVMADGSISNEQKRAKLREYVAFLAVLFVHEVSHALHTILRPGYFLDESLQLKCDRMTGNPIVTPLTTISNVTYDDFGEIAEVGYLKGASCVPYEVMEMDSDKRNPFKISSISLRWLSFKATADITVESTDFQPETYVSDGLGLFGVQISLVLPVVESFNRALRVEATGVVVPEPGTYPGDIRIQECVRYTPTDGMRAKRRLGWEFEVAAVAPSAVFSSAVASDIVVMKDGTRKIAYRRPPRKPDGSCSY